MAGGPVISLLKRLFTGFGRGGEGSGEGVALGAFGKHPGWDDHLEDPRLSSPALIDARRILYADAIRANIESGAWKNADNGDGLDSFDHTFLWSLSPRDDILIVGRLLPSRDAKGRDKYPLVLCAELRAPTATGAIPAAVRRLDALAQECAAAVSREEFLAALDAARANASSILFLAEDHAPVGRLVRGFVGAEPSAEECFARCLYALHRELAPVADRQSASGTGHVRLPLPPDMNDADALGAWLGIIRLWIPTLRGVLLVKSRAHPWIDALVPIPLPAQLACIRSPTSLVPLVCDVPYNLDPTLIQRARTLAEKLS